MRWFWQRRRRQAAVETTQAAPASAATVERATTTSGRLGQPRQLSSDLLVFAREYLQAVGGRVRVEDEDVLSATMPDGSLARYTTTLAKARSDASMMLLVEGGETLASMLDDIAARSRLTAMRLTAEADPAALALDQGRQLLRWRTRGRLTARVVGQEDSVAVELAYLVAARDRHGRSDEWIRLAVDTASGRTLPTLSNAALTSAQPNALPADCERLLAFSRSSAERALHDPLAATGLFLRQRSLDEYRKRLEEVASTFDRLQRESPETARAIKAGRTRELAVLSEVYAVDVEAQLESACIITSPLTLVAIRPAKGQSELPVRVDLARQHIILPDCATCSGSIREGYVCDAGHVSCAECATPCARCDAWRCAACGEPELAECANCGAPLPKSADKHAESEPPTANDMLTVRHLEALPPAVWLTAFEWLLFCQGVTVESRRRIGSLAICQGRSNAGRVMAAAIRPDGRKALDESLIRQAAAHLALEERSTARIVLSTASSTTEAAQVAQQLGIQLLDRQALESLLARQASAYDRERERQLDATQACANAASAARQAMLDAVEAVGHALAALRRARRVKSRTMQPGIAASRALSESRATIERASLAWETLLSDWADSFGVRPARNGALVIQGDVTRFMEMSARATHLQTALLDSMTLLAETPAQGDAGYTSWRQAVVEECVARCEAWGWRIRTYDPSSWSDFDNAWNAKAAAKAAEATTAAGHATARADKAQAQVLRAG